MRCQRLDPKKPEDLAKAAQLILQGELVAFPTETVYGLGALALNDSAIQKIYEAKGRPSYNPLIVHVASANAARELFKLDDDALFWKFAHAYWPGPLTLVAPKVDHIPALATGGLDKVAVRVPAHPVALELLRLVGQPMVAPSANASTRPSATTAEHVLHTLGDKIAAVLDAGPTEHGLESTVVDISVDPPVILRLGALQLDSLELSHAKGTEGSPGRTDKHYAPLIPEIRWATREEMASAPSNYALLTRHRIPGSHIQEVLPDNPAEYGKELFAALYRLEQSSPKALWIEGLPKEKKWDTVRDRIKRSLS